MISPVVTRWIESYNESYEGAEELTNYEKERCDRRGKVVELIFCIILRDTQSGQDVNVCHPSLLHNLRDELFTIPWYP